MTTTSTTGSLENAPVEYQGVVAQPTRQYLQGHSLTGLAVLQALLAPVLMMACLGLSLRAFGQPFGGSYLILAILAFALAFPGRFPRTGTVLAIVVSVLADWLLVITLLGLLGWVTQTLDAVDWRIIATWAVLTPVVLFAAYAVLPVLMPYVVAATGGAHPAIIVGSGRLGCQLADTLEHLPMHDIRIMGFFDDRVSPRGRPRTGDRVLGSIDQVADYAKRHQIERIYITLPMASQPRIIKLLEELRDTTASIYFTPDIFLADLIQARVDTVGGMPVIAVCETPHYGINGPLKRISDIVLASLILLLVAPLMGLIALGIRLQSPGPVIFKQRRYGLDGRQITVYKFRSMKVAEDGPEIRQATRDDDRVTPLGAFLRRTSLDELPQFINVLQGTMSVVGPRPHAVAHNEMYRRLIDGYMLRHKVKPGITGWAQVNGLRGETDTLDKMEKRVEYDLDYLRNWSLRWDLEIILKTPFVALKDKHAY